MGRIKQNLKPNELEDMGTEESKILEHRNYAESIGFSRDNIKIRKSQPGMALSYVCLVWKVRSIYTMQCLC